MQTEIEKADAMKVDQALNHLNERDIPAAEALLRDVCSRCPENYQYDYISDKTRYIKFWAVMEFTEYVSNMSEEDKQQLLLWLPSAYPRACFYLAYILVDKRDLDGAMQWLKKGQSMEPGNPNILLEMGVVFAHMKRPQGSFNCYQEAFDLPNLPNPKRAAVLRGMGIQLMDLNRLDEAEERLMESLELEPDNSAAKQELLYLSNLRTSKGSEKKKSWLKFWN